MALYRSKYQKCSYESFLRNSDEPEKSDWTDKSLNYTLGTWGVLCVLIFCTGWVSVFGIFWSVFSRIWTKYGDLLYKSRYSVQMRESMDQKTQNTAIFYAVFLIMKLFIVILSTFQLSCGMRSFSVTTIFWILRN